MKKEKHSIIHEDDAILVVSKPSGMASISERYVEKKDDSLLGILRKDYPELLTVHRIDKETSGLLVFAKTKEAHRLLSMAFENRKVKKHYLAIVKGRFSKKEGEIDKGISPDRTWGGKMKVNDKGKKAQSLYKVVEEFRHYSLVDVQIITGRTHQIRVHMTYINHPLMVDEMYAGRSTFMLSSVKRNYNYSKWDNERPMMKRLTLHSWRMTFDHPENNEAVTFEADMPKDMQAVLKQLRKWDAIDEEPSAY